MSEFHFYPEKVVWEVTFACNMRCLHCGTSAGKKRDDELTTQEALDLIDELVGLGCKEITLSGGEPLMRKDWPLLAEKIKKQGLICFMISNGYAMTEEIAKEIKRVGIDSMGISFDGNKEVHNHIRQRDESYDRALDAMRMLIEAGVQVTAVSQISNLNLGAMDQIRQALINVGCKLWQVQMTTPTGRMKHDMVLTRDKFPAFIDKILEFKKDNTIRISVGENIGFYGCKGTQLREDAVYLGCYAGVRIAGITSNGEVRGCLSMPDSFNEGSIRDKGFTAIWNNPDGFPFNRKFTRESASGDCYDCKYLRLCRGGCSNTSFSLTGERANNPYCIYQVERKQGIDPEDTDLVKIYLDKFPVEEKAAGQEKA